MLQCCEATPPHVPEDVLSVSQAKDRLIDLATGCVRMGG